MPPHSNEDNNQKTFIGNPINAVANDLKKGAEETRDMIHEATKSQEQKEAENKTFTQKIGDSLKGPFTSSSDPEEKTGGINPFRAVVDDVKVGVEETREMIHEATKTDEQKLAERSIGEKIGDTKSKLGDTIGSGVQQVKGVFAGDKTDEQKEADKSAFEKIGDKLPESAKEASLLS